MLFRNTVSILKLNEKLVVLNKEHKNKEDLIKIIIVKFHPSIVIIKNKIKNNNTFCFKHIMLPEIKNEIKGVNPNKATTHKNLPPKRRCYSKVLKLLQTL